MTSAYHEAARDALRRERTATAQATVAAGTIVKLVQALEKPSPVILDHSTARYILKRLEKLDRIEKEVRS